MNRLERYFDDQPADPFENETPAQQIAGMARAAMDAYREMILAASCGEPIDRKRILYIASSAGKSPVEMLDDLRRAQAAYFDWQHSVH